MHFYYFIFVFVLSFLCYFATCSRFFINYCTILFAICGTVSTYDYDHRKTAYMLGMESIKSAFNGEKINYYV